MYRPVVIAALLLLATSCASAPPPPTSDGSPQLIVLGIAQDAGVPQAGTKEHPGFEDPAWRRFATSLGLVHGERRWLIEATPDFKYQLHRLDRFAPVSGRPGLDGIVVTHAHVGHYAGLVMLGHEVMGSSRIPLLVMPKMADFLRSNGPWSQLVCRGNVELRVLRAGRTLALDESLTIEPFLVPHRDEFSETIGLVIRGPRQAVAFLPDIDSWEAWEADGDRLEALLARVDVAYLDATFFADGEIPGRDMSGFPHPFITTTMERLSALSPAERGKVRFIHLNHTNPALWPDTPARRRIESEGFRVATEGEILDL